MSLPAIPDDETAAVLAKLHQYQQVRHRKSKWLLDAAPTLAASLMLAAVFMAAHWWVPACSILMIAGSAIYLGMYLPQKRLVRDGVPALASVKITKTPMQVTYLDFEYYTADGEQIQLRFPDTEFLAKIKYLTQKASVGDRFVILYAPKEPRNFVIYETAWFERIPTSSG